MFTWNSPGFRPAVPFYEVRTIAPGRTGDYGPTMGQRVQETERKYEAAGGGPDSELPELPDLSGLPAVAATRDLAPVRLDAVYYDTAELALAAHRRTLRRRTGGDDAGWHLKLPTAAADTRTEVHAPLDAATTTPPEELRAEVAAVVRGRPLAPVLRLRTTRRRVLLLAADGGTLAEVAHDEVEATVPPSEGTAEPGGDTDGPAADPGGSPRSPRSPRSSWAEIEVELYGDGDPALLDAVEERFTAAGLRRSAAGSKLARALGDRLVPLPKPPARITTAGEVATGYLHAQLSAILALDPAVRRAEEDAVHRMRVATRRSRSVLKSFRPELDRKITDPLGDELKWLAAVLGMERDREVLAERLARRLAELDPALVGKPLRRRLRGPAGHTDAHAALVRELDGTRYFSLLDTFESLLAAPPYRRAADAPAVEAATATVRRDHARLRAQIQAGLDLAPGDDRDIVLHEARKDAKRARYSSEAAEAVLGTPAAEHTARMKGVQQLLGEHQDSVMCRVALHALREQARAAGEDTAPYDAIDRREREIAADVEAKLPAQWRAADRTV